MPTSFLVASERIVSSAGEMHLDREAAPRGPPESLAKALGMDAIAAALSVIEIGGRQDVACCSAVVSVERGFDPRDFVMVGMGGAGPIHSVADLARQLHIPTVIIPVLPSHFSPRSGMLMSDIRHDYVRTQLVALPKLKLRRAADDLRRHGRGKAPRCSQPKRVERRRDDLPALSRSSFTRARNSLSRCRSPRRKNRGGGLADDQGPLRLHPRSQLRPCCAERAAGDGQYPPLGARHPARKNEGLPAGGVRRRHSQAAHDPQGVAFARAGPLLMIARSTPATRSPRAQRIEGSGADRGIWLDDRHVHRRPRQGYRRPEKIIITLGVVQ